MRSPLSGVASSRLAGHGKGRDGIKDLQVRLLARRLMGQLVVDFRELGAEASDVDRARAEQPLRRSRENMARISCVLPMGRKRDEHAGVAIELRPDGLRQTQFLARPGEALGTGPVPARRLDDEHVEFTRGKACPLHDRLVIELNVSRVKNRAVPRPDQRAHGAENVAGIEKLQRPTSASSSTRRRSPGHIKARVQWRRAPAFHGQVHFPMGKKWVAGHALIALLGHDVDRIVQHHVA